MDLRTYLAQRGLSQAEFAALLGVTQGLVWQWLNGRTVVTAERALAIEQCTGGEVTRAELRPDLFGPSEARAS
jgi:DNA-binding transcriptional regulator YdaS (Cro superfamily)